MNRLLTLGLMASLLSGCAVALKVPVSRFDIPEVLGQIGKFRVSGGYGTLAEAVLTQDYTNYLVDTDSPTNATKGAIGFLNAQAGLLPWLDVQYKSLNQVQAKAQFMGSPEPAAVGGNFSGAVTLAIGYQTQSEAGIDPFSGSNAVGAYKLNQTSYDTALIWGYRTSDKVLIYGGPFVKWIDFDGSQRIPSATTSNDFNGKSRLWGGNAGVRFSQLGQPTFIGASVYLELGYYQFKLGSINKDSGSGGISFEFQL